MIYGHLNLMLNTMNMTKRGIIFLLAFILTIILLWMGKMVFADVDKTYYTLNLVRVNDGWGYEIQKDNQPFIVQLNIPVVEGNKPFNKKYAAKKTGSLVLSKLQKGLSPSISIDELLKLRIVKKDTIFKSN